MLLTVYRPRFGMEKEAEEDGAVIPVIDNMPNKMFIEMDFSCEGIVEDDEYITSGSTWFEMTLLFKTKKGNSIFTHDMDLIFNFCLDDFQFFIKSFLSEEKRFGFYPTEPYGYLEVDQTEIFVNLKFYFDANYYLLGLQYFGFNFFIELSVTHEQFKKFIKMMQVEVQRAYTLCAEYKKSVFTSTKYSHEVL